MHGCRKGFRNTETITPVHGNHNVRAITVEGKFRVSSCQSAMHLLGGLFMTWIKMDLSDVVTLKLVSTSVLDTIPCSGFYREFSFTLYEWSVISVRLSQFFLKISSKSAAFT